MGLGRQAEQLRLVQSASSRRAEDPLEPVGGAGSAVPGLLRLPGLPRYPPLVRPFRVPVGSMSPGTVSIDERVTHPPGVISRCCPDAGLRIHTQQLPCAHMRVGGGRATRGPQDRTDSVPRMAVRQVPQLVFSLLPQPLPPSGFCWPGCQVLRGGGRGEGLSDCAPTKGTEPPRLVDGPRV